MTHPTNQRLDYPVTLRVSEEDWRILKERAEAWGIQPAVLVRILVRSYLRNLPLSLSPGPLDGSHAEHAPSTERAHKSR